MTHSQPDGSTMQRARFRRRPSLFLLMTWGNGSRSIPRMSRDQWLMAAFSCAWLRSAVNLRDETRDRNSRSGVVFRNEAEGVGFEPTRTRQRPNGFQDPRRLYGLVAADRARSHVRTSRLLRCRG